MRRRAIRWLADEDLISPDVAERARAKHPEPVVRAGFVRDVADDLRALYGDRLAQVLVLAWTRCSGRDPSSLGTAHG